MRKQNRLSRIVGVLCSIFLMTLFISPPAVSGAENDQAFRMPNAAPAADGPPLKYADSRRVLVVFKSTPEALRKLVPAPLAPNKDSIAVLMAGHWKAHGFQSEEYNDRGGDVYEVALMVPAAIGKKQGSYIATIYLDNASRLPMSREIWGFPKILADVKVDETESKYASTVTMNGRTLVKLDFERTGKIEPLPAPPPSYVFNLKKIPSIKRGAPPEVLQVTAVMTDFRIKQAWKGRATLELNAAPGSSLTGIPVVKVLSANDMTIDGALDYGEVVHDYLSKANK